jgi:PAS domain-containing protein
MYYREVRQPVMDEIQLIDYASRIAAIAIERKRAEEKLRQDEQELRGVVDAISQTVVVLSPDGRGLYANRPLLDYTGLTMQQLMAPDSRGNPVLFHPEDCEPRLRVAS